MLDHFLLSRVQVKEASAKESRLIGELGLKDMSLQQLQKLAMMDGGGAPPGGDLAGVAGAPPAEAPPGPGAAGPGIGPGGPPAGDGTSNTAAEDIGAAVGAAMKVIKDKEQQQAEVAQAAAEAQAAEQAAQEQAAMEEQQAQAAMEQQAIGAQSEQPNLPPTFPPGQEPQAPPPQPPAGAPAAGGAGGPPPGGPPGGMPPKQAFAYLMKQAASPADYDAASQKAMMGAGLNAAGHVTPLGVLGTIGGNYVTRGAYKDVGVDPNTLVGEGSFAARHPILGGLVPVAGGVSSYNASQRLKRMGSAKTAFAHVVKQAELTGQQRAALLGGAGGALSPLLLAPAGAALGADSGRGWPSALAAGAGSIGGALLGAGATRTMGGAMLGGALGGAAGGYLGHGNRPAPVQFDARPQVPVKTAFVMALRQG